MMNTIVNVIESNNRDNQIRKVMDISWIWIIENKIYNYINNKIINNINKFNKLSNIAHLNHTLSNTHKICIPINITFNPLHRYFLLMKQANYLQQRRTDSEFQWIKLIRRFGRDNQ